MSVIVSSISDILFLVKVTGSATLDVVAVDTSTGIFSSSVLPAAVVTEINRKAAAILPLVSLADRDSVSEGLLTRLVTVSPANGIGALTLSVVVAGSTSTLRVSGLASPSYLFIGTPHSLPGGIATDYGFTTGGGGGGTGGVVDAPAGSGPFSVGTPVAIVGGVAVACDAASDAFMPCVGLWTADGKICTDGPLSGLSGLTADAPMFVAVGGGLTSVAPETAGTIQQRVGTAIGTTTVFVSIRNEVLN